MSRFLNERAFKGESKEDFSERLDKAIKYLKYLPFEENKLMKSSSTKNSLHIGIITHYTFLMEFTQKLFNKTLLFDNGAYRQLIFTSKY